MRHLVLFLCLCAPLMPAFAADSTNALRDYFESVRTLTGDFEQTTTDDRGKVVDRSEGTFAIARPDRFDWLYQTPFEQRIVADGRWLYSYDPALAQVSVRSLDQVLGAGPAVVLSGDYQSLRETFEVSRQPEGWYRLVPTRGDWDFQSVRLRLSDGVPTVIEVDDGLGQTTRLQLSAIARNKKIPEDRFRFEPPDDADVIAPPEYRGDTNP